MATLGFGFATTSVSAAAGYRRRSNCRWRKPTILAVGWVTKPNHFSYVLWSCLATCVWKFVVRRKDPEGVFGPPQTGHLAGLEFRRRLERDAEAREAFQRQVQEEKERRQTLRQVFLSLSSSFCFYSLILALFIRFLLLFCISQSRIEPDTPEELIEYFLDTEAQEIEFEIARMRPRFLLYL